MTYHEFVIQLAPDELDALLVRGQSVGVVADGRVHVTETGRDSMNEFTTCKMKSIPSLFDGDSGKMGAAMYT